ncbi:hypothetical protein TGAM01_v210981 [Trichoderma gamsii]|uniref:Uncharacterized protein n=1 Tax=Trichoderma gamsii TaxID=398673 RepID=A0A2P4Z788_9HYPO|nr:hypothetical protein TGAM01_v210981 [Trichoderma gamsii]PON20159.1 hypothetical protein TGAM01_v210981 [Trichoderma gamsii]
MISIHFLLGSFGTALACSFTPHVHLGVQRSAGVNTTFTIPLLDDQCLPLRKRMLSGGETGQHVPSAGVRAWFASKIFFDSTGSPLTGADLVFALNAIYPGGLFAAPFTPPAGLGYLDAQAVFDSVVCEMIAPGGATFSLGGPFPDEVVFAGGRPIWVESYGCYIAPIATEF